MTSHVEKQHSAGGLVASFACHIFIQLGPLPGREAHRTSFTSTRADCMRHPSLRGGQQDN
jgi:hypothetical protein